MIETQNLLATVSNVINIKGFTAVLVGVFIIAALGYLLGSIHIKGVSLGTAGVFLVAILFGYLFTLKGLDGKPILGAFYISGESSAVASNYKAIQNIGLVLFVTAVGFVAGPNFFHDLKKNATSYVLIGVINILIGALLTVLFALIPGIGAEFSAGILSGALTSTPGFSAAQGATDNTAMVALGHAIAYPFGVVGVVLFVQIMPRMHGVDIELERRKIHHVYGSDQHTNEKKLFEADHFGLFPFSLAVIIGIFFGAITIPLSCNGYGGATFSLGNTGGPLIVALIIGHFGKIGKLSLRVPDYTVKVFREFGLMLFLIGAGVEGGVSLVSTISSSTYGPMIILYGFLAGVVMTMLPMIVGFIFAKRVLKISLFNNLGSICGGMTSTPALGSLIDAAETEDVAGAYASTYPIALVLVVIASNLIVSLL